MIDRTFAAAAFCVCGALLAVLLRRYCQEQSLLIAAAVCAGTAAAALSLLAPMLSDIEDIFTQAGLSGDYISLIFKATAVCLITQITCGLCKDCGESAIASAAEIWGRAAVAFISLPLIKALIGQISECMQVGI